MPRVAGIDGIPLDLDAARIARFVHEAEVGSTMDVAHALANDGAASGTVVVADVQHAGRGRSGKSWRSVAGDGVWCTVLVRDAPASGLDVLSLRLGLVIADVVSPWCDGTVGLKWPNDVLVTTERTRTAGHQTPPPPDQSPLPPWRKLAGVLVEARWRDAQVEWIAVGIGLNLRASSDELPMASLRDGVTRAAVLQQLVPRVQDAAQASGELSAAELTEWNRRDISAGRACSAPLVGVVAGVRADGALRIVTPDGREVAHRSGSLSFVENVTC